MAKMDSKGHLKSMKRRGDGRWCYDPRHIGRPCRASCSVCQHECNKAYWGKEGKMLRNLERLVGQ